MTSQDLEKRKIKKRQHRRENIKAREKQGGSVERAQILKSDDLAGDQSPIGSQSLSFPSFL